MIKQFENKEGLGMSFFREHIKTNKIFFCCIAFILAFFVGLAIFVKSASVNISINTPDDTVKVTTIGNPTTAEVLAKADIELNAYDYTDVALDEKLESGDEVTVTRAKSIMVTDTKKTVAIKTALTSETDIMEQAGFNLDDDDTVQYMNKEGLSFYAHLKKNQKLIYEEDPIKYKTVYKKVATLGGAEEKVTQDGKNGKIKYIKIVTYGKDKKAKSSKTLYKKVASKPKNKIVQVAEDAKIIYTGSGSAPKKYSQKISVVATGYCPCAQCCGKSTGITASGARATAGRTVAAWSGLSFGTQVYFPYFSVNGNGGVFTVEDRGGAITGNRIDIFFSSHSQALSFGRRTLECYILK